MPISLLHRLSPNRQRNSIHPLGEQLSPISKLGATQERIRNSDTLSAAPSYLSKTHIARGARRRGGSRRLPMDQLNHSDPRGSPLEHRYLCCIPPTSPISPRTTCRHSCPQLPCSDPPEHRRYCRRGRRFEHTPQHRPPQLSVLTFTDSSQLPASTLCVRQPHSLHAIRRRHAHHQRGPALPSETYLASRSPLLDYGSSLRLQRLMAFRHQGYYNMAGRTLAIGSRVCTLST